jgi:acetyltransferase-like isoleucine patch superfamily enzyme
MENSFYSDDELIKLGLKSFGRDVFISRFVNFYNAEEIEIGNNVRIDDFCILSGKIKLGSHIHVSAFSALYGRFGIELEDYTGLSPRCTLFSAVDDFSGKFMIGPMIKTKYTNVTTGKILIKKYSQIGCNTVILPGVEVGEGSAVGALSLVTKDLQPWKLYAGIPAKEIKDRSKDMLRFVSYDLRLI